MLNLSQAKKDYVDYMRSNEFFFDVENALLPAYIQLKTYYNNPKAIVAIDVDDTMVTSFYYMHAHKHDLDFGWTKIAIEGSFEITDNALMPKIDPIYLFLKICQKYGISVYILTGRREQHRTKTVQLLSNNGYDDLYKVMAMKPTDSDLTDAEFKDEMINLWINQGYNVIMMIGDQESDTKNNAELKIKIPNKGYDLSIEY
jgi:predicted secreted acid phosphatase